jgi:hypothetical protein
MAGRMHAHTSPSADSAEREEVPPAPETASPMPAYGQALELDVALYGRTSTARVLMLADAFKPGTPDFRRAHRMAVEAGWTPVPLM